MCPHPEKKNLYNPVPHPYYVFFYYKRNPAEQRIKYIENYFEKISESAAEYWNGWQAYALPSPDVNEFNIDTNDFTKKDKVYFACDGLQGQIAKKAKTNDFLIYTKSSVQINFIIVLYHF